MAWTDEEFDDYVDSCHTALQDAQRFLQENVGINQYDSWDLNQQAGTLIFSSPDKPRLICVIYALGTYSSGVWKWAWANESLLPDISKQSLMLKKLAERSGMNAFELESFKADEDIVWDIVGMGLKEIGGKGIFVCPSSTGKLYVVIEQLSGRQ